MSTYQHPADGPTPMCPGGNCPPGQSNSTSSQNPTWVAFRALCSSFTVTLNFSGCTGSNCNRGLQAAIYADCGNLPGSVVSGGCSTCYNCTTGIGCGTSAGQRVMNVTGLVPGQIYRLLVDGCSGSACQVTIDVDLPPGCVDEIRPWTGMINGPADVCVGDAVDYMVNMPVGGTNSTWVIKDMNGNIIENLDDGGYFPGPPPFTKTRVPVVWNTVGTFQICVDVFNACVPVGNLPAQLCKTINVYDVEAGTITAVTQTGCPGRTVDLTVTGANTSAGVSQYILVVDNNTGNIVQVTPGTSGTFTYNNCGNFTAYSYNYVTTLLPVPMVGQSMSGIITACGGTCCELESVTFSFSDNIPPVFASPPPNITVNCVDNVPPMNPLSYTDNCIPAGSATGVQTGSANSCGGSLTRTWTITDGCNNTATHVQTITVTPTPAATFTPFNDVTVSCVNFPPTGFLPLLNYTNNQSGSCLISG